MVAPFDHAVDDSDESKGKRAMRGKGVEFIPSGAVEERAEKGETRKKEVSKGCEKGRDKTRVREHGRSRSLTLALIRKSLEGTVSGRHSTRVVKGSARAGQRRKARVREMARRVKFVGGR